MEFDKELKTAIEAAKKAGSYLKSNRDEVVIKKSKGESHNYATVQDLEADKIIVGTIKKSFPDDAILSEESESGLKHKTRMWIIDPIDGTRNFANGFSYFCVSIAFCQEGEIKVGVIYAPCYNDELFHAVKGRGAFLNDKPLKTVNPGQELESTIIAGGFGYFRGRELKEPLKKYEEMLNQCSDVLRLGSAALDLCNVAAGRLGSYYGSGLKPWDLAAGMLILQEQKGVCSDYKGKELDLFRKVDGKYFIEVTGSKNAGIHSEIISILKS